MHIRLLTEVQHHDSHCELSARDRARQTLQQIIIIRIERYVRVNASRHELQIIMTHLTHLNWWYTEYIKMNDKKKLENLREIRDEYELETPSEQLEDHKTKFKKKQNLSTKTSCSSVGSDSRKRMKTTIVKTDDTRLTRRPFYVFDILIRTDHNARDEWRVLQSSKYTKFTSLHWDVSDTTWQAVVYYQFYTTRSQGWSDVERYLRFGQDNLSIFITINELRLALSAQEERKRIHTSMTAEATKKRRVRQNGSQVSFVCHLETHFVHVISPRSVLLSIPLSFYISNLLTFLVFWIYVTILIVVKIKMTLIDVISENTTQ